MKPLSEKIEAVFREPKASLGGAFVLKVILTTYLINYVSTVNNSTAGKVAPQTVI